MVWLDLEDAGIPGEEFAKLGGMKGLRFLGGRLVVHYQISDEAVSKLEELMKEVLQNRGASGSTTKSRKVGEKAYGT
jgi:threonine aldolase